MISAKENKVLYAKTLRRYRWSLVFLFLSLIVLPIYVFFQTRVYLAFVMLEKERVIYEEVYEKNLFLTKETSRPSLEDWQNFSKLGLKKILAKNIPIVIFAEEAVN